jgi:putative FmdB family regulatory protein
MPLYEYRCRSCGTLIEVLQKLGDRPLRSCERCSGRLEKLISRTSFHLRGGGWFADGYGTASRSSGGNGSHGDGAGSSKESPAKGAPAKKGASASTSEKTP